MRLIDAEVLLTHMFEEEECHGLGEAYAYRQGWNDAILTIVEDEPTVEPPRMHGVWTKEEFTNTQGTSYGAYKCSLCGAFYQDIGYEWYFCPNCGAEMGEQDVNH